MEVKPYFKYTSERLRFLSMAGIEIAKRFFLNGYATPQQ